MDTIESRISGIPCIIQITDFVKIAPWKGSIHSCPSSDDYYGYIDCEFKILDRKGYDAPWLERKMTHEEEARITEEIEEYYASYGEDY